MPVDRLYDKTPEEPSSYQIQYDNAAFQILFKSHFTVLCAYCQFKYYFDLESAREVVHTTFIKLWENRSSLAPDIPVKPYLYKIVNNTCLDLIKHKKIKQQHERYVRQHASQHIGLQDSNLAEVKLLKEAIDKAVAEMPAQMRKVFTLSRYEGLKYAQIAVLLNISVKTVDTQMSRALHRLKIKLANILTIWLIFSLD
ncbi:RNA polymerase sigma-70 factor [Flavitalea sp.]|nr:RNA polymerase sigma-70 factor [Flavitalea sp.]